LKGLRILLVEDEFIILVMLEDMLAELGCELAGSASRLSDALAIVPHSAIDAAVLDINLGADTVYPLAEALAAQNVPIVFSTGYGLVGISDAWKSRPILQKPYQLDQLAAALTAATAARSS